MNKAQLLEENALLTAQNAMLKKDIEALYGVLAEKNIRMSEYEGKLKILKSISDVIETTLGTL